MVKIARTTHTSATGDASFSDRRTQDICGLILFFMGVASLLCLALPQTHTLPVLVDTGLRLLAGTGAYAIPLLLMFAGTMFLIGYERLSFSHSSYGTVLLFFDFITWRHLELVRAVEAQHLTASATTAIVMAKIPQQGGWGGWLFGEPLHYLLDRPLSYLFLILLMLIAVVLIVDQPFIEILRRIHAQSRAGALAAGLTLQRGKVSLTGRMGGEEEDQDQPRIPAYAAVNERQSAAADMAQNRAERAARVVERALVPSGRSTAPDSNFSPNREVNKDARDLRNREEAGRGGSDSATHSKSPNLFNITRFWRGEEADREIDRETKESGGNRDNRINRGPGDGGDADTLSSPVNRDARADTAAKDSEETNKEGINSETPEAKSARSKAARAESGKGNKKPDDNGIEGDGFTELPVPSVPIPEFTLPPLTLLALAPPSTSKRAQNELTDNVSTIERTLEQFNIGANVVEVASGPSVTRYEIQLAPGIKVSKIVSLADNLAMSLAAIDVRVEAPIPGKSAIGVEVPNATPTMVTLRECLEQDEFKNATSRLTVALGKDVSGQYKYADLTRMPHLLIGGSTNSGKSVCLNVLIASLVYRNSPRDVRMLMIDPKRVELSLWDGIPHLMHPVVKDVKQAAGIFRAALREMDRRYDMFATLGTRNIDGYNQRVPDTERLPYLVLIVDELADLMMQQGPEVETSICRLAQLARATGIHLVIATQRPSVDIITGTIKANISSRIAFAVASQVDSRTILDMTGADRLIGRGDMLFMPIDASKPIRIQGCYLSETETNAIVDYLKEQEKPVFTFTVAESASTGISSGSSHGSSGGNNADTDEGDNDDQFFEQAVRLVVNNGQASTSMLQRRFRIGYTRAARIVEMMEEKGIVGPLNGAKPRELLVSKDEVERMFNPGASLPSVDAYQDEE